MDVLSKSRLLPILTIQKREEVENLSKLADVLAKEGLPILEITLRTPFGLEALDYLRDRGLYVGAGTIRTLEHAKEAVARGASFLVSPAYSNDIALFAREHNIPYLPGVLTPQEVELALSRGLSILKFFPAEPFQGSKVLAMYAEVMPEARFLPTGGINEKNLAAYCSLPNVIACGGSWLLKGSYETICQNIRKAKAIVNSLAHG